MSGEEGTTRVRRLRVAYLVNRYPAVSHTFIRRELTELERRGHEVTRVSIRALDHQLRDPADLVELGKTLVCLGPNKRRTLAGALARLGASPGSALRTACEALRMGRRGSAGVGKHAAYLVEAAWLARTLRARGVEHLHAHFGTNPAAVARLCRLLGGPPYSFTVHGPDEFDDPRGHLLAEKIADAGFVVGISDFTRSQLQRWARPEDWGKLHVVRCTVGPEFFDDPVVEGDPRQPATPTFLNIGRLSAQKGQLVLIDAFARLVRSGVDARLVLIGDGEMRRQVEDAVRAHGVGERVELAGSVGEAEVRRRIRASWALALPSSAEGLPMVLMESLAARVPAITTYIAGIPELVRDGESGVLLPAGRPDLLADAMARVARMPAAERLAMGERGRAAVAERHSTAGQVEVLERLLLGGEGSA
jgi:glycosyltransferase involved in cell wall biosynthesis